MAVTFKQGIHPDYNKEITRGKALKNVKRPEQVIIPLKQHIGAPCQPLVDSGDYVKMGEKIGDNNSFISAPVHASVSGTVEEIIEVKLPNRETSKAVVINSEQEDNPAESIDNSKALSELKPDEIRNLVKEAGITGRGGAMFPTHAKITIPEAKEIEHFILNGAECEPYLTVDERVMMEWTEEIIQGMKYIMSALKVKKGIVAIEDNKQEAIKIFRDIAADEEQIEVKVFKTKYPQGGERMLIKAALDREVPEGGLPLDVGVVVNNVLTAASVCRALKEGMPLIERPVCVTGEALEEPGNYIARIGTPIKDLIEQAGGFKSKPGKVIVGGPMMGVAQPDLEAPLIKGSSGILALPRDLVEVSPPLSCIRCARCVDACPMHLMPTKLMNFVKEDMIEKAEAMKLESCIECGCCSYVCPSRIPLVHYFRLGKAELQARKRDKDE